VVHLGAGPLLAAALRLGCFGEEGPAEALLAEGTTAAPEVDRPGEALPATAAGPFCAGGVASNSGAECEDAVPADPAVPEGPAPAAGESAETHPHSSWAAQVEK